VTNLAWRKIGKWSDILIIATAEALSVKQCVFVFVIIATVPLFYQLPKDIISWQNWLSQTFIQLVALSILAIVNKLESAKITKLLQETHDTVMSSHDELHSKLAIIISALPGRKGEKNVSDG
jgi:predicted ferric reductase